MSASFLSATNTRANHLAIDEENKQLKKEVAELMKKKEELKKELEELNNDALLIYKPEWSDFEGKKLEAWTEYVTEYGWSEEIQLRLEEFEEQYEDCMQCGIDPDYLFTQDEMEENHLCDDDSEYCGDDFLINTGWVYNECIKRWIHRDNLPDKMNRFDFADLTGQPDSERWATSFGKVFPDISAPK